MGSLGRLLIVIGILLIVLGLILTHSNFFTLLKLGRLPGDTSYRRGSFSFYFPLTTCVVLSIILMLIIYLFKK
jgi:uncharacterized membrane protein